tara:strand:- start:457 stop:975 length:519 start_codon:yes stop_codon:yes gene_type:complete
MLRKEAADEIAGIFQKIMSKSINKTAGPGCASADDGEQKSNMASDCAYAHDEETVSNMASDMMVLDEGSEARHGAIDNIDNAKDHLHKVHDKKMANLMSGLGKIAASLRSEGEDFAADVVEATAISISRDNNAEQNKTAGIVGELKKISSELRSKDKFAADLVDSTINKIIS